MRQLVRVVFSVFLISSAVTGGAAIATQEYDMNDIYLADDEDPKAGDVPRFAPMPLSIIMGTDVKISNMANSYDFYYLITQPTELMHTSYGQDASDIIIPNFAYSDYVDAKYNHTVTDEEASKWPTGVEPVDGRFIKDAYIENTGVEHGYKYISNESVLFVAPERGAIRTTIDYRVSSAEESCIIQNDTKTCEKVTPTEVEIDRTFSVAGKSYQWSDAIDSPNMAPKRGIIQYKRLPSGSHQANVTATFEVTLKKETTRYTRDNGSWTAINSSTDWDESQLEVEDEFLVQNQDSKDIHVKQRVINRSSDENIIVLHFSGPSNIEDRRLWSYVRVSDKAVIENVWGLYSARHSRHSKIATNTQERPVEAKFPVIPTLHLTAVSKRPKTLFLGSSSGDKSIYSNVRVTTVESQNFSSPKPVVVQPNVDLPAEKPARVRSIVIRGSDADSVEAVRDIQNEKIDVSTVRKEYRNTRIATHRVNESAIQLTLLDESGQPVPGKLLHVNLGESDTYRTNSTGDVIVHTERRTVTAHFYGDDYTKSLDVYYGQTSTSTVVGIDSPFWMQIYRLITSLRYFAAGFVVALVLLIAGKAASRS